MKRDQPVRVGLVGLGAVARNAYLPALANASAQVCAVTDPAPGALAIARRELPGCEAHPRLENMLTGDRLDAVVIAAPPSAHCDVLLKVLAAGVPVLVEKPMCLVGQLHELLHTTATEHVMVAHTRRFWRPYQDLIAAVHNSEAGELQRIEMILQTAPGRYDHRLSAREGGALHDLAPHMLDLMCVLCGGVPQQVVAKKSAGDIDIRCDYPRGLTVSIRVGFGRHYIERVSVQGTMGALCLSNPYGRLYRSASVSELARAADQWRRVREVLRGRTLLKMSIGATVGAFMSALNGRGPFAPGWADGMRIMQLLAQITAALDADHSQRHSDTAHAA